jgi:hypothetical protein
MEGDDGEPTLRLEQVLRRAQPAGKLEKHLVEMETNRLEGPRRRVFGFVVPPAKHPGDDLG